MGKSYKYEPPKGMVKFTEMKVGQLFYDVYERDTIVYELLDAEYKTDDNNWIKYTMKRYKSNDFPTTKTITGDGVRDRTYFYVYTGRDRSSFVAGFRMAMDLCLDHMQIFDKENAGLDNPVMIHMTMNEKYNNWVRNIK